MHNKPQVFWTPWDFNVLYQGTEYPIQLIHLFQGGMKAVIWVDSVQLGVMVAGMIAVVIQGSLKVGGMANVFTIAAEGGRINFKEYVP